MRHLTSQFAHSKKDKSFVAEAATIGRSPMLGQIYPDSIDEGMILISAKTGAETKWVVVQEHHDDEGDLLFWELHPTAETLRKNPQLSGYTVTIFND